jgi:hypothetical protein
MVLATRTLVAYLVAYLCIITAAPDVGDER